MSENRPAVLLDLAGDKRTAMGWAAAILPQARIELLDKAELKRSSKRTALAMIRAMRPVDFLIFTSDVRTQSGRGALMLFAVLAGARRVIIGDGDGNAIERARLGILLGEAPRLALELLAGYLLVVPLSWLLTEALGASLGLREVVRASQVNGPAEHEQQQSFKVLYIRATLSSVAEGGMSTHVAGLVSGATALGHRIKFLKGGTTRCRDDDALIGPSTLLGVNRTLFELWNNLVFTTSSLLLTARAVLSNEFDFIYQRYSRFNWTGGAISAVTGVPLLLEYNGSEVWMGRHWDRINGLWLLKRFERLNLRAADLIFVVSNVERRNLVGAGINPEKIIVNPNGVDTDRFRSGRGGVEVRRALGLEGKLVVGFVGTFGPWHGATVLAEAAARVDPHAGCHFLFVGDGDERPRTESIAKAAGVSATFTGRIAHEKVPAYLESCDLLVSPNVIGDGAEFFGSPTKLFEYMAMARPVVVSRVGQLAEVISHGENGLLVEPGNVEALARAIERLARDEPLRARLGAAARRTVLDQYTWRYNAARVFQSFEQLMHTRGGKQ